MKDELARIEAYRVKLMAKQQTLNQALTETYSVVQPINQNLARSKQQLADAKENFLKELNRRDPQWAEKIRQRKDQEIQQMNAAKQRIQNKVEEREH